MPLTPTTKKYSEILDDTEAKIVAWSEYITDALNNNISNSDPSAIITTVSDNSKYAKAADLIIAGIKDVLRKFKTYDSNINGPLDIPTLVVTFIDSVDAAMLAAYDETAWNDILSGIEELTTLIGSAYNVNQNK